MPVHDDLGCRMKEYYEAIPRTKLMRRTPVAIRIDGKAFHTFTRGFQKPFDNILIRAMQDTMQYLCENIQGCVLGYTQSDEITLILTDYKKLTSCAWFDYEVQKVCSIAASMATMAFNRAFNKYVYELTNVNALGLPYTSDTPISEEMFDADYIEALKTALKRGAMFDARCFNVPKDEVTNLIYWRQLDATRNSIQMVGQAHFSHSELHGKNCSNIQDMLMEHKGINWNDLPVHKKRGSCCVKEEYADEDENIRSRWIVDNNIPIFKGEDREYVDRLINFD